MGALWQRDRLPRLLPASGTEDAEDASLLRRLMHGNTRLHLQHLRQLRRIELSTAFP
ncbi:MAG: hypothetical protein GPOALKHO_000890 [Sodalis sp.]|nr:MAG: hypothetical protein GPOALKHO_000890 [Sodalis sp.]